jgi:hypothetical protein
MCFRPFRSARVGIDRHEIKEALDDNSFGLPLVGADASNIVEIADRRAPSNRMKPSKA